MNGFEAFGKNLSLSGVGCSFDLNQQVFAVVVVATSIKNIRFDKKFANGNKQKCTKNSITSKLVCCLSCFSNILDTDRNASISLKIASIVARCVCSDFLKSESNKPKQCTK